VPEPLSTYRLQLTPQSGFAQAAGLADYLADLGVSHVYLSPVLEAVPGSVHGYDVTDHSRIRAEFGGERGFRAMAREFRERGLGLVVDIVPNHMAVHQHNRQLWDVLAHGQDSGYAHWFDIDWAAGDGRFLLPILDDTTSDDDFTRSADTLWYRDIPLPLDGRHYRLAHWRTAAAELNWRRFFDVTTLIGIRQEDPAVFRASHELLFRLIDDGLIDGLRVDHPDGLADPRGYFGRLADAAGDRWVVAEKILERGEQLPAGWRCAGTTGYDALAVVDGLFVDPAGRAALTALVKEPTFAQVARQAKHEVSEHLFPAEVARLTRLYPGAAPADVHAVLIEIMAAFPVYRAYVHPGEPAAPESVAAVTAAAEIARQSLPHRLHHLAGQLAAAILGDGPPELITRFQQTTGPVLAKGVEDTASYRWPRLLSLNEVGSDPDRFGVTVPEFHAAAGHLAEHWPHTMTTLSTHDTKRQEDVRARLAVLAECPPDWSPSGTIDAATEYLVWQTLVGAWPIGDERLGAYLTKALREAKTHTSWTEPAPGYEQAVLDFARAVPEDEIAGFVAAIAPYARVNSLGAKLVQLTMPGVPDVYQGCELGGFSLVDPDNRRPVDHVPHTDLDREKLLVTTRALHCRRDHPDWFRAGYTPLTAEGPAKAHVIAFTRGQAVTVATRLPKRLQDTGGWAATELPLPGARWHDLLTGSTHTGDRLPLAGLTRTLPVALLVPA
jgi:(1->4)-alpha-D-glucan 1-alpha-D-glucosylmutase